MTLNLNTNVSMVVKRKTFVDQLDGANNYNHENCHELTKEEWAKQPWHGLLLDNLARIT